MTGEHPQTLTGRRTILIAVGIVLVLVAILQWARSRQLESRIVAAGGQLIVDNSSNSRSAFVLIRDRFTNRLMGNKDSSLHHIFFSNRNADDRWLAQNRVAIEDLSAQTWLTLKDTQVSSNGLAALRGIEDLWTLDISGTPLTDEAIEHVSTMPDLRNLDISHTGISDQALAGLRNHPTLNWISVDANQATKVGIEHIVAIPRLFWLRLVQPTAATLRLLPRAMDLTITDATITPEMVKSLQTMARLKSLRLEACHFEKLPKNRLLNSLPNCKVTVLSAKQLSTLQARWLAEVH